MTHTEVILRSELRYRARQIARAYVAGCSRADCVAAMQGIAAISLPALSPVPADLAREWAAESLDEAIDDALATVEDTFRCISRGWRRWAACNW